MASLSVAAKHRLDLTALLAIHILQLRRYRRPVTGAADFRAPLSAPLDPPAPDRLLALPLIPAPTAAEMAELLAFAASALRRKSDAFVFSSSCFSARSRDG